MSVPAPSLSLIPLPPGKAGTHATVEIMRRLIREGSRLPRARGIAASIVSMLDTDAKKIDAIHSYVINNCTYVRDNAYTEQLTTPDRQFRDFLKTGQMIGDCDDHVVVEGTLLGAVGYPVRIVTVRQRPGEGAADHVFLEVWHRGKWWALDATAKQKPAGWRPRADIVTVTPV